MFSAPLTTVACQGCDVGIVAKRQSRKRQPLKHSYTHTQLCSQQSTIPLFIPSCSRNSLDSRWEGESDGDRNRQRESQGGGGGGQPRRGEMCPKHNVTAGSNSLWLSQLSTCPFSSVPRDACRNVRWGSASDTEHPEALAHLLFMLCLLRALTIYFTEEMDKERDLYRLIDSHQYYLFSLAAMTEAGYTFCIQVSVQYCFILKQYLSQFKDFIFSCKSFHLTNYATYLNPYTFQFNVVLNGIV